jgi:alginate O-acetyltransferase complex protein AlgI
MVFSSHLFLFYFLPLVLLVYYAVPVARFRMGFLAFVSYAFYGWANPPWALIMFFSTIVDYFCGLVLIRQAGLRRLPDGTWPAIPLDRPRTRGMLAVVVASVCANMALLAFFKYYNFTEQNVNALAEAMGGKSWVPVLNVVLPVGVSFYTFKSMSYCIDVYRGEAPPMSNFIDFNAFEAMFPDLVAGPIIRYGAIAEQMRHRTHTHAKFARGVAFFACGMGKKILLANPMGHIADTAFATPGLTWYDSWYGLTGYAFQIYFDFSGYSDMAVGLALMFGFLLIENFDQPYRADSITDFWRRWHISLSTWLRDYLYIPLGGNRKGNARTYLNLMTVMLLGGLWHGSSWNFVIWGAIHGGMLAFERFQGKDSPYRKLPRILRVAVTFAIVCVAWVFFRADTLGQAVTFIKGLFGVGAVSPAAGVAAGGMYTAYHVAMFALAAVVIWGAPKSWRFTETLSPAKAAGVLAYFVLAVFMMWTQTTNPFLYFQF